MMLAVSWRERKCLEKTEGGLAAKEIEDCIIYYWGFSDSYPRTAYPRKMVSSINSSILVIGEFDKSSFPKAKNLPITH